MKVWEKPLHSSADWLTSRLATAVVASWLLTSCVSPQGMIGGGKKKGRPSMKGIAEYFVGPGVMQYFLLPQKFEGPDKQYAELDITVRDSLMVPKTCMLHVSIVGQQAFTAADSIQLVADGQVIRLPVTRILFTEPVKKDRLTRWEIPCSAAQTTAYLRAQTRELLLVRPGGRRASFRPTSRATARLTAFQKIVAP